MAQLQNKLYNCKKNAQWQFSFALKENCHCAFYFAVVQFVLQLCHVFCSCAFSFADVLKLCTIPTYNFADVQMKCLLCMLCIMQLYIQFVSCELFSERAEETLNFNILL
jgi:hypothetical protein